MRSKENIRKEKLAGSPTPWRRKIISVFPCRETGQLVITLMRKASTGLGVRKMSFYPLRFDLLRFYIYGLPKSGCPIYIETKKW